VLGGGGGGGPGEAPPMPIAFANPTQEKQQSVDDLIVDQAFKKLVSFDEAKNLYDQVNKKFDGKLKIVAKKGLTKPAEFDPRTNEIQVDLAKFKVTTGKKIINLDLLLYYILIEIANAENNQKFDDWDKKAAMGDLSRKEYAEGKETLEYESFKKAQKILEAGVKARKYNPEAYQGGIPELEAYLKKQREGRHTAIYERQWDEKFKEAWKKKHPCE
jgi:hypothetical protein